MKKDAYYFSHDSNSSNDEKIVNLRVEHEWAGYGLYWAIIEKLRDANSYRLQCNFKAIAYHLNCSEDIIKSIVCDFDLFIIENNYFFSESLIKRMELKEYKSQKARESANKRWGNNANAMPTHNDSNASKGKESKVKEKKVNKSKVIKEPTLKEFTAYCQNDLKDYDLDPENIYYYYADNNWCDSKGNKVKNWKSKVRAVWCKTKKVVVKSELEVLMSKGVDQFSDDFVENPNVDMPEIANEN